MSDSKEIAKKQKAAPQKEKKEKKGLGRKLKEVFSELKKVTWPSLGKTVKQTGVVIGVVAVFLVFLTAVDSGLSALLNLIWQNMPSS